MCWCVSQEPKVDFLSQRFKIYFAILHGPPIVLHSAIASIFCALYPHMLPIASNVIIQDFFQAKLKTVVELLQQPQIKTWNMSILTKYITTNFSENISFTIDRLQQKTILLLCIATMWGSRSDIGTSQTRDVHFKFDNDANLTGVILFIKAPKEAQQKHSALAPHSKSRCVLYLHHLLS